MLNDRMSRVAGLVLLVMGAAMAYFGIREIMHLDQLTRMSAYATIAIGVVTAIAGLIHFKAPHKAFLMSIPSLLFYNVQLHVLLMYYLEGTRMVLQAGVLLVSLVVLYLSYAGYKKSALVRV